MVFASRADDIIDLAGFTRLEEKTLWSAIMQTGFQIEDWTARKEVEKDRTWLKLYLEAKEDIKTVEDLENKLHQELCAVNRDYRDLSRMLDLRPLKVVVLSAGSFQRYYTERQKAGADLSHLKPPHMNPSDLVIDQLLKIQPGQSQT